MGTTTMKRKTATRGVLIDILEKIFGGGKGNTGSGG